MIGIWDDHDYGINDGGQDFKLKDQVRNMFLDFLDEPNDSIRRMDRNSTIHQNYIIMDKKNNFKVNIILLDNRFSYDKESNDRLGE